MTDRDGIDSNSPDQRDELISRLKYVAPEVFTDGAINLDRLTELVGLPVDNGPERYGLTWPGKRAALAMLQAPSAATLAPDMGESANFDTAQHVFIEGENLEVLKLLYKSYFGRVKLIYIDPPYNTGNDFIYHDDFADPLSAYLIQTGQMTEGGDMMTSAPEKAGRFHSNWLSMMYPRLSMARQMLREDGFIVVSIDDAEQFNLRSLLNDVFGEENFVANLVLDRNRKNDAKLFSVGHLIRASFSKASANGLPAWFQVPTPIGSYNPDWAIVMGDDDDADRLYLVRETKGTTHLPDLRPDERRKILCGRKHFREALSVDYRVVTSADQLPAGGM